MGKSDHLTPGSYRVHPFDSMAISGSGPTLDIEDLDKLEIVQEWVINSGPNMGRVVRTFTRADRYQIALRPGE